MIILNERIVELFNQPSISSFLCISVAGIRLTTFPSNLVLDDGIYTSSNLILSIDEPQMTSTVDRDLYKMSFSDSERVLMSVFESGINGADINVRAGFVDYYTEEPELNHLFVVYKGIVESYSYDVDTAQQGSATATISCSNLMASLDDSNPYYTSKQYIRSLSSGDTSFDQIYEGSGSVVLRWGKK